MGLISLVMVGALLVVLGVAFQLGMFFPTHDTLSPYALVAFVLAGASMVGASFARPRAD
ncbi:MAG: hypothetical protein ABR573_00730 [Candidatus Dormibacteria bacterium]